MYERCYLAEVLIAVISPPTQEKRWDDGIMFYVWRGERAMDRSAYADSWMYEGDHWRRVGEEYRRSRSSPSVPTVRPWPIISLLIPAAGNWSHGCSLDRGEFSTMLTTTSPCSCVLFKTCLCRRHLFWGAEWEKNDPSQAAVNKITAHTGSYIPLIHHRLPAAPCHTPSLSAAEKLQSERLWGNQRQKTGIRFWLVNTYSGDSPPWWCVTAVNELISPAPGDGWMLEQLAWRLVLAVACVQHHRYKQWVI